MAKDEDERNNFAAELKKIQDSIDAPVDDKLPKKEMTDMERKEYDEQVEKFISEVQELGEAQVKVIDDRMKRFEELQK